jgi:hypothetical protein
MQTLITGLKGWAKMQNSTNEALKVMDTAITVVATLLVAVTWAVLRG